MPSSSACQTQVTQPHLDEEHSHMESQQGPRCSHPPDLHEEQFLEEESLVKISFCIRMCYYLYVVITGIF